MSLARAIDIPLRTAHVAAMAIVVGGTFATAAVPVHPWLAVTAATGAALLLSEASHSRHWVYQGRGLIALAHVAVLGAVSAWPGAARPVLVTALVVGSVGSHLPRSVRKWSLRHRRVME
jgi:hypothetical protein